MSTTSSTSSLTRTLRRAAVVAAGTAVAAGTLSTAPAGASPAADVAAAPSSSTLSAVDTAAAAVIPFQVPFICGQTWVGSTRSSHSPQLAIDFNHAAGDRGRRVVASADGKVIIRKELETSYGNYLVIRHANGMRTLYAHMLDGSLKVRVGDKVKRGQVIGKVGSSGNSDGDHLHYEQQNSSGNDVRAVFYRDNKATYFGKRSYMSPPCR